MGSRSRTTQQQTQQQTQTQQLDPEIRAAFLGNYNRAVGAANNLQAREFADFTPDQLAAFEATRNAVGAGNASFGAANNALTGLLNFDPGSVGTQALTAQNVQGRSAGDAVLAQAANAGPAAQAQAASINRGDIRQVQAERLRDTDLSAYMNPYTTGVIDTALSDLERSRQMQRGQDAARAAKAGAFGGSRQAVLEAETNRAFDDNAARTVAGLRQSAFQNAQQAAMGDIANQMAAGQFNAGIDANVAAQNAGFTQSANQFNAGQTNQMGQFNAGLQNQVGLANAASQNQMNQFNTGLLADADRFNAGANNQMSQFNAGQDLTAQNMNMQGRLSAGQLGLSAAGQLGQLGALQQQSALQGAAALDAIGAQQQMLAQQRLDAPRNLEQERLGIINQSLGLLDPNMGATVSSSGSSSGSSTTRSGGLGQALGLGMQLWSLSDERAKEDIKPVGGGFYSYKMKGTGDRQVGVLAQEVESRDPGAVVEGADGLKRVNYARATGGLLDGPMEFPKRRRKKGKK